MLNIYSKELSSLSEMDKLFENYCKDSGILLDFSKSKQYNAYVDSETASAYIWFIRGIFRVVNN